MIGILGQDLQQWQSIRVMFLSTFALFALGCGGLKTRQPSQPAALTIKSSQTIPDKLRRHVLMLNERGRLFGFQQITSESTISTLNKDFDLESGFDDKEDEYPKKARKYVREILTHTRDFSAEDWVKQCGPIDQQYPDKNGKRKLLIFVHGGLNSLDGGLDRAKNLYVPILCAGYYPVFVNWNSGLLSSYKEHLLHIRQGTYRTLFPIVFGSLFAWGCGEI